MSLPEKVGVTAYQSIAIDYQVPTKAVHWQVNVVYFCKLPLILSIVHYH
jgi:hypothetical protein